MKNSLLYNLYDQLTRDKFTGTNLSGLACELITFAKLTRLFEDIHQPDDHRKLNSPNDESSNGNIDSLNDQFDSPVHNDALSNKDDDASVDQRNIDKPTIKEDSNKESSNNMIDVFERLAAANTHSSQASFNNLASLAKAAGLNNSLIMRSKLKDANAANNDFEQIKKYIQYRTDLKDMLSELMNNDITNNRNDILTVSDHFNQEFNEQYSVSRTSSQSDCLPVMANSPQKNITSDLGTFNDTEDQAHKVATLEVMPVNNSRNTEVPGTIGSMTDRYYNEIDEARTSIIDSCMNLHSVFKADADGFEVLNKLQIKNNELSEKFEKQQNKIK